MFLCFLFFAPGFNADLSYAVQVVEHVGIMLVLEHDKFAAGVFFALETKPVAPLPSAVEHLAVGAPLNLDWSPTTLAFDLFRFDLFIRGF